MAKVKRKSRNKIDKKKVDLSKPVDIRLFDLGSDKDPCFGLHHDVKAPECRRCGDSEMCLLMKARNQKLKVEEREKKLNFKDVQPVIKPENDELIQMPKYIKRLMDKGYDKAKIIRLTKKKFPNTKEKQITKLTEAYGK